LGLIWVLLIYGTRPSKSKMFHYKRKVNILLHTFMTHFGAALAKNFWDPKLPSGTIKAVKKFSHTHTHTHVNTQTHVKLGKPQA